MLSNVSSVETIIEKIANFKLLLSISESELSQFETLSKVTGERTTMHQFAAKSLSYSTIKKLINLN